MNRIDPCLTRPDREPLTLSVPEAAKLLGVSPDLVYDLVAVGELPALRLGRRIVVPRRALEELVEAASSVNVAETQKSGSDLEVIGLPLAQKLKRASSRT
jgi:excisionase family DNA binding protein